MNIESKEHLSSFMDGEFSEETGRFLVRRLGADDGLRETWARYHLIRDCLRNQDGQFARKDLTQGVQLALSGDPASSMRAVRSKAWIKPMAGIALAASIAAVAVLTVSQGMRPGMGPAEAGAARTTAVASFTPPNILSVAPRSQPVSLSGEMHPGNQKMNTYLLRHYQVSGESGGRGFISFVPIVAAPSQDRVVRTSTAEVQNDKEGDSTQR